MSAQRSIGLPVLLVALVSAAGPARGADSPAVAALKEKGLTKSGHAYVIDAEAPVLAKIKEARAAFASHSALADRQAMAEQGTTQLNQLEERRIELQSHLNDLNQQIIEQAGQGGGNMSRPGGMGGGGMGQRPGGNPITIERDQAKAMIAEIAAEQKMIKAQVPLAKDRSGLDESVKKADEAFRSTLATLRPLVDEVTKKYAELAADPAVVKAMDELKKASKAKIKLGPSDAFLAAAKQLDQAERQFLGKKAPVAATKKKAATKARK